MCCPCFFPEEPASLTGNPRHAMLPLGGFWMGSCRPHPPDAGSPQDANTIQQFCALGYARGYCSRFPEALGPDAVRFTVTADDGVSLRLRFVWERDHHPFQTGPLEYSRATGALIAPPSDATFERQVRAYVESYLRRKDEARQAPSAA